MQFDIKTAFCAWSVGPSLPLCTYKGWLKPGPHEVWQSLENEDIRITAGGHKKWQNGVAVINLVKWENKRSAMRTIQDIDDGIKKCFVQHAAMHTATTKPTKSRHSNRFQLTPWSSANFQVRNQQQIPVKETCRHNTIFHHFPALSRTL